MCVCAITEFSNTPGWFPVYSLMERNTLWGHKHYRECRPMGTVAKFVPADNVGCFWLREVTVAPPGVLV